MPTFQYSPQIIATYPQVVGGIILAHGMSNPPTPDPLSAHYQAEQEAVKARIGETPLSELTSLNAWRRAFSTFGVSPTQYRSAAEALLRRLTKKGDIPSINTLVDIGNMISIRYALPIAIVDTREIQGAITVHFADGTENYTELGNEEALHPDVGEVIFSDVTKMVVARRWCWRQSESSAATPLTTSAVITIEGHHEQARRDVQNAVTDILDLLQTYAGGTYQSAILTADNPAI